MDDKARKEKLKQERKELRKAKKLERQRRLEEQEDKNPLKFKEWFFFLKGIRQEIKNVHWLTKKELARDAFVVICIYSNSRCLFLWRRCINCINFKDIGVKLIWQKN